MGNNINTQNNNNKRIGATLLLEEINNDNNYVKTFLGFHEGFKKNVIVKELEHTFWNKNDINNKLLLFKSLKNSNLPEVYEIFDEYNKIYIVMEYKNAITLKELTNIQKQSNGQIIKIMLQICDALSYLLSKEIIHNYLNEDNIYIDISKKVFITDYVVPMNNNKILDLANEDSLSLRKECTKIDIENLGKILCFLCEGKEQINSVEGFSSNTSSEFIRIISRALNINGFTRYISIKEFENSLKDYLEIIEKKNELNDTNKEEDQDKETEYYGDDEEKNSSVNTNSKKKEHKKSRFLEGAFVIAVVIVICTLIGKAGYLKKNNLPIVSSVKSMKSSNDDYHLENTDPIETDKDNNSSNSNIDIESAEISKVDNLQTDTNGKDDKNPKLINPNATSGSLFNGTVNITVTDYAIDEDKLMIKLHVQNNYKSKVTISNDKLHIMNEKREMFLINKDLMEKRQPDEKTVDIMSEKDFTFYFDYKPSENLTLCIEEVLCDTNEDRNKSLELKVK